MKRIRINRIGKCWAKNHDESISKYRPKTDFVVKAILTDKKARSSAQRQLIDRFDTAISSLG